MPGLYGKSRQMLPAMFQDIVFMRKKRVGQADERVFTASIAGVFGPGSRSGVTSDLPADVGKFLEHVRGRQ